MCHKLQSISYAALGHLASSLLASGLEPLCQDCWTHVTLPGCEPAWALHPGHLIGVTTWFSHSWIQGVKHIPRRDSAPRCTRVCFRQAIAGPSRFPCCADWSDNAQELGAQVYHDKLRYLLRCPNSVLAQMSFGPSICCVLRLI